MSEVSLRKWQRREYLRRHAANRRAMMKAEGARRIDITLQREMLDNYAVVRGYLEYLNQLGSERGFPNLFRLSDTEVINMALKHAARSIAEEVERDRRFVDQQEGQP